MGDGWLSDPETTWTYRFHRDDKSWLRDPKVFVDMGRPMSDGQEETLVEDPRPHPRRNHWSCVSAKRVSPIGQSRSKQDLLWQRSPGSSKKQRQSHESEGDSLGGWSNL